MIICARMQLEDLYVQLSNTVYFIWLVGTNLADGRLGPRLPHEMCQRSKFESIKTISGKCTVCVAKEARRRGWEAQAIKDQKLEEYRRRADDYEREAEWNEVSGNSTNRMLAAYKKR